MELRSVHRSHKNERVHAQHWPCHTCVGSLWVKWPSIFSLYMALACLMPFFKLCLAMLYCALSPDLKAVLRSLRRAWTPLVIQGFLLGGILMRVLVVIFSTQVLMQQRTAKAYSFTY